MGATGGERGGLRAVAVAVLALGCLAACTSPGRGDDDPAGGAGPAGPLQTTSAGPSSTGVIAFSTARRGQVVVTRPDGTGVKELVSGSSCCTTLSPDGRRLAFLTQTSDGRETTGTMTVDGQDRQILAPPAGVNLVPGVWAADGTRVWLAAYGTRRGDSGVLSSGVGGADLVRLTSPPGTRFDLPVAASPDGAKLLVLRVPSHDADPFEGDLFVVPTAGGPLVRLNPEGTRVRYWFIGPGNFFPDSQRVTFAAVTGPRDKPVGRVMVATVDGSSVAAVPLGSAAPAAGTTWTLSSHASPDGRWIAFDMWAPLTNSVGRQGNSVFVVHPDGSGLRQLDTSNTSSFGPVWSPDGTAVLCSVAGNDATNLRWIAIEGTAGGDVTTSGGETFVDYGWAPAPPS